jgi:hypothetical protein
MAGKAVKSGKRTIQREEFTGPVIPRALALLGEENRYKETEGRAQQK